MSRSPKSRHAYREAVLSKDGPTHSTARLVAIALTMRMDARTLESFASIELVAELTRLSERTVSTAIAKLRREGWIEERTKARGREFWLKYRRATLPDRLPEESAGSQAAGHPEEIAGTRLPANGAGVPAIDARLPAIDGATACKTLHGDPAGIADDPVLEILKKDPVQDPGANPGAATPPPADAGSAAHRRWSRAEIIEHEKALERQKQRERQDLLQTIRTLRAIGWTDERILKKHAKDGVTDAHLKATSES